MECLAIKMHLHKGSSEWWNNVHGFYKMWWNSRKKTAHHKEMKWTKQPLYLPATTEVAVKQNQSSNIKVSLLIKNVNMTTFIGIQRWELNWAGNVGMTIALPTPASKAHGSLTLLRLIHQRLHTKALYVPHWSSLNWPVNSLCLKALNSANGNSLPL